ncbi:Uncharacterised protein [Bordetella pertussis]|nr:Uncharacterised protein [Bordetella pertussis]
MRVLLLAGVMPGARRPPAAVLGQVQAQRRHRDLPLRRGVEVRPRRGVGGQADRADPVHRVAIRRGGTHHRLGRMALAQPRDGVAFHVLVAAIGDIDVEQDRRGQRLRDLALDHLAGGARGRFDVLPAFFDQREGDRGDAEQVALAGRGHRAGIKRVVAHVGAVVDAGHHQVGTRIHQAGQGDVHAIGRRAVDVDEAVGSGAHRQRPVQGQGVRGAAVIRLRRDHGQFAQPGQRLDQRFQPGGVVTIVV